MRSLQVIISASLLAAGCQNSGDNTVVTIEPNSLGITHVEIDHGFTNGDRLLTVTGLDDADQPVATAMLRTGMVLYTPEPDLIPAASSPGTELAASVGQDSYTSITPDREPHTAPLPDQATVATYVRLPAVAQAISAEAGIQFPSPATDDEVAFTAAACSSAHFPDGKGNPSECCEDGTDLWHKVPSGGSMNLLAHRTLFNSAGTPCLNSAGATGCVDAACTYGPCGAASATPSGTTAAAVFHPTSAPTQCGHDPDGTGAMAGTPENFTGAQTVYAGVTASCPYTACNANGQAGVHLTLTARAWAGTVSTIYGSVTYKSGLQTSNVIWVPYNTAIQVTASPGQNSEFIGWTGACSGTGSCTVTATVDTGVGATFQCVGLGC